MFGQIVVGPPGSGKSTYCKAMQEFLKGLKRKVVTVNLDPANDALPYHADVDLTQLITVNDVMENLNLGPNGALIYCMEYLLENLEWLTQRLTEAREKVLSLPATSTETSENDASGGNMYKQGVYFLFDFPGQVELYTHNTAVRNLLTALTRKSSSNGKNASGSSQSAISTDSNWPTSNYRLTVLQLMDSTYCTDPGKYVSVVLTALNAMIQLEMPLVNVLSKFDLLKSREDDLPFGIDYFTEVMDLKHILECIPDDPFMKKYQNLSQAICGVVEDYSLVSFVPLDVNDKQSMLSVLSAADKANGFCFGTDEERSIGNLMSSAYGALVAGQEEHAISPLCGGQGQRVLLWDGRGTQHWKPHEQCIWCISCRTRRACYQSSLRRTRPTGSALGRTRNAALETS